MNNNNVNNASNVSTNEMSKEQFKEELERIKKLDEELKALKEGLVNKSNKSKEEVKEFVPEECWRAEEGEMYYFVGDLIIICTAHAKHSEYDLERFNIGNYFQTREQAIAYRDWLQSVSNLRRKVATLNKGWKPDWSNEKEEKYYIYLDKTELNIDFFHKVQESPNFIICKTEEIAEQLIQENEADLRTYFKGF